MPFKILLIDDELNDPRTSVAQLKQMLEDEGYHVAATSDGREAYQKVFDFRPDVIVLDIGFGHQDVTGIEISAALRADGCEAPIILMTRIYTGIEDLEQGFAAGADDYVRLPVDKREIRARIRANLPQGIEEYDGYLRINRESQRVHVKRGEEWHEVSLRPLQFRLLRELADHAGQPVEYWKLADRVWGKEEMDEGAMFKCLCELRARRRARPAPPHLPGDRARRRVPLQRPDCAGKPGKRKTDITMVGANPLTGYGISNLELLFLLLGLAAIAGLGYGLAKRRWSGEARRREAELAVARAEIQRLQAKLAETQGQWAGEAMRLQRELDEARASYDPVQVKRMLELSEREIAHRFGSRLFDIAERCREAAARAGAPRDVVRVLNDVGAQAREMLHESRILVAGGALGSREPAWETLQPRRVLESVIKEQLPYAEAREVRLLTDYDVVEAIVTDRGLLHDLCEVVIQNAVKFSPPAEGEVRVWLHEEDGTTGRLFIDVRDNGCGIEPKDYDLIFEPNLRGDGRRAPGGGLGLAYGRRVAGLLGGDLLLVESRIKEGSLFRINLPRSHADAARAGGARGGDVR